MPDPSYLLNPNLFVDRTTERALLGLVLGHRRIPPALRDLREEHFADEAHRALWSALLVLHATDPASPDAAADDSLLREMQAAQPAGGAYLQALSDACPDLDVADLYVRRLLELYHKRRLWQTLVESLRDVRENAHTGIPAQELCRRQAAALQALDLALPGYKVATWADLQALDSATLWDWPGWLPRGCLVLLAAASGMGKSLLALRLAASYLRGDPWPDGSLPGSSPSSSVGSLPGSSQNCPRREGTFLASAVLWCESEAAQFLNLKRARAWGLPCRQLWTPLQATQNVQLARRDHRAAVARLAARPAVRFVVVDSLSGASHGAENAGQAMDLVQWLAELARDTHKPVLLLHHLRKRSLRAHAGAGPHTVRLDDLRGHSGIVQPARIVLALDAPDPARPHLKRLSVVKSSLAAFPPPLGFCASAGDASTGGAPRLRFCAPPQLPRPSTLFACAVERLRDLLAQGPLPVALVRQELVRSGLSRTTVHRARTHLGISTARQDGCWVWRLPPDDAEPPLLDKPSSKGPGPT